MARGTPSMVALLGLLAVAGYQNREKIGEFINSFGKKPSGEGVNPQAGQQGALGRLGELVGGTSAGGILSDGLGGLVDQFKQSGQGNLADSWVKTGPNQPVTPNQVEQAIGSDVLAALVERTGLSRDELLARLSQELPNAVDKLTPDGRIPNAA
jgi:uncharacterized protein YidB (DUF937 family)